MGGGGCRERKTEVEGGGGMHWGKNREGVGLRGTNHITSLLLTSPRAATKGGTLSCLLYSVGLACFLSPRREKDGEQRVRSLHCSPPLTPHTQRKTDYHSCKNKIKTPKTAALGNKLKIVKIKTKGKKQIKTAEVKLAGLQSAAAAAVVTHILPLRCLSPHTHTSPPLAHTHTSVNSFNSPAVPPLPLQRGEMNDFSELSHLSQAVPVRTGFSQLMRK